MYRLTETEKRYLIDPKFRKTDHGRMTKKRLKEKIDKSFNFIEKLREFKTANEIFQIEDRIYEMKHFKANVKKLLEQVAESGIRRITKH